MLPQVLTPQSVPQQPVQIAQPSVELSPAVQALLQPGRELPAQLVLSENGTPALSIRGTLIPIEPPKGIQIGDALTVLVERDSSGKLILQLTLSRTPPEQPLPLPLKQVFENILESVLPELSLESLKKGSFLPKIPVESFQAESSQPQQSTAAKSQTQFLNFFEHLIQRQTFLTEQTLQEPRALQNFLKHLLQPQAKNETQDLLTKISDQIERQQIPTNRGERLLQAIGDVTISLDRTTSTSSNEVQVRFSQAVEHLLKEVSLQPTSPKVATELRGLLGTPVSTRTFPQFISQIISTLSQSIQSSMTPQNPQVAQGFEQLLQHFSQVEQKPLGPKELRVVFQRLHDLVSEQFQLGKTTETSTTKQNTTTAAFRALDSFLSGQEALNKMNPMMKNLGEPIFILIPTLLHGLMGNWEMSVEPRRVNEEESEKQKGASADDDFERIHLSLELPHLGNIQVDLAHRKEEILLSLTFGDEDITEFVDSHLPHLERALFSFGYTKAQLTTRTGSPSSVQPRWYRELTERTIIA